MTNRHQAVGTLIHVDGLLEDAQWSGSSGTTLTKIYDTIERLTAQDGSGAPDCSAPSNPQNDRINPGASASAGGPDWALSGWESPGGPCYIVHHLPTSYTIRTHSLKQLNERIIERFSAT